MKPFRKSKIKRILVNSLSNIGDVILTFPVVDILMEDFPEAKVSIIIGPKAKTLLEGNPNFEFISIYDKFQSGPQKFKWVRGLREKRFDLVVDLRNSLVPFMIGPKYRTPLQKKKTEEIHMKQKHLNRLSTVYPFAKESTNHKCFFVSKEDQQYLDEQLNKKGIAPNHFVVMSPGSANEKKCWGKDGFAEVADYLSKNHQLKTIFVGDEHDRAITHNILKLMDCDAFNFCGQTNLIQSAELINRSKLVIVNDSAPMHMASYLNKPTLALFGDSSPVKYGPWSKESFYIDVSLMNEDFAIRGISAKQVIEAIKIENDHVSFKSST